MKLTALFLALSSGIVLAAPVSDIQKREDEVGVYLCNDRGYSGYCQHIITSSGDCIPLEWDLNDQVSAAGPDWGSFCTFYVDPNCDPSGGSFQIGHPGYSDLSQQGFEDQISSYRCNRS